MSSPTIIGFPPARIAMTSVPEDTAPARLRYLREQYRQRTDLPAWYRAAMLARLDSLLGQRPEAA
jgi:hypothetical protein